ncbi:MAG: FGGY-family carbohydrate kinase [Pseudomonadota bacterium]
MTRDVIIGLDAGTSVIKAVAFDTAGRQIGSASRANSYRSLPDGGVEQDMARTWDDAAGALAALGAEVEGLAARAIALSVTAQGDGTWLIDAGGRPLHDAWLWLDARAAPETRALAGSEAAAAIYETCGSGLNVCQMRTQLLAMRRTHPGLAERAATAFHCKDWIYLNLTGRRATDPTEGCFTFGDFRTRRYADAVIEGCGLGGLSHLLPPIVDGAVEADGLTAAAAAATGLPEGLPVTLGYVDIMCTALGAGLHDAAAMPGLTILGSTGVHMRFVPDAGAVVLNDDRSGYTMAFPGAAYAQMQTNMAATLNIDWMLDLAIQMLAAEGVARTRADLLAGLDDRVMAARPGAAVFHPYISAAGERGPFAEPDARAAFTGLDQTVGWFDLMRGVYEGLAMAARDCYAAMGPLPEEIRLTGGAARSRALRAILAAALDRPVRTVAQPEAGAAGAAMIAAVQQGLYPDVATCSAAWALPLLGEPEAPDRALARHYDALFEAYRETRLALAPAWGAQAAMRAAMLETTGEAP